MARIFVSHAAKDAELVEELVDLLHVGVGIHPDDVFCSSLPGMNIPTGTGFIDYIRSKIEKPELLVIVVSPEFLKSQFCNNEVGASWALSLPMHPLLVPPLDYGDVRGVLAGTQVGKLNDKESLKDEPLIVAHRGLLNHAPENTLANFRACLELRIGFEFDVEKTKDGQLVCIHDGTVD